MYQNKNIINLKKISVFLRHSPLHIRKDADGRRTVMKGYG